MCRHRHTSFISDPIWARWTKLGFFWGGSWCKKFENYYRYLISSRLYHSVYLYDAVQFYTTKLQLQLYTKNTSMLVSIKIEHKNSGYSSWVSLDFAGVPNVVTQWVDVCEFGSICRIHWNWLLGLATNVLISTPVHFLWDFSDPKKKKKKKQALML